MTFEVWESPDGVGPFVVVCWECPEADRNGYVSDSYPDAFWWGRTHTLEVHR